MVSKVVVVNVADVAEVAAVVGCWVEYSRGLHRAVCS